MSFLVQNYGVVLYIYSVGNADNQIIFVDWINRSVAKLVQSTVLEKHMRCWSVNVRCVIL